MSNEYPSNGSLLIETKNIIFDVDYINYRIKDKLPNCILSNITDIFSLLEYCNIQKYKVCRILNV